MRHRDRSEKVETIIGWGLRISPLDKNDGKLHVCCPMFYKMAMDKVFDREDLKSYEEIKIGTSEHFFSEYKKGNISDKYKTVHSKLNLQQQERELMDIWEWFYHHKNGATSHPLTIGVDLEMHTYYLNINIG